MNIIHIVSAVLRVLLLSCSLRKRVHFPVVFFSLPNETLTTDPEIDGFGLTRFLVSVSTAIYPSVRLLDLGDGQGQISIFILARRNEAVTFETWTVAHLPALKRHERLIIFFPLNVDVFVRDTLVCVSVAGESHILSDANAFQSSDLMGKQRTDCKPTVKISFSVDRSISY